MGRKELFKDRDDASVALMQHLPLEQMKREDWLLVGISEDAVVIAGAIGQKLGLEIEWLVGAAITAPANSNCELGRVSETQELIINDDLVKAFDIKYDYVYAQAKRELEEKILSKVYRYRKGRVLKEFEGRNILLIDDGADSGLKLMCAIKTALLKSPNAVYIALPVIPKEVKRATESICDSVFFVHELDDYIETSCYYGKLESIEDEMIIKILGN